MPLAASPAGLQIWGQDLNFVQSAATTVTGTTSGTSLVPVTVIPANYLVPGMFLRATICGKETTGGVGTTTFSALYSGATIISAAISVMNATVTCYKLEFLIACTAIGSLFAQGWFWAKGLVASPGHLPLPASAPAVTSGLTFSAQANLDFQVTPGTSSQSITSNLYALESMGI